MAIFLYRNSDINTQGHVYDVIEILEPRQQKPGKAIQVKPQHHVKTDINEQRHVYDEILEPHQTDTDDILEPHQHVQTAPQGKEIKDRKKPRFATQNISFSRDQQTAPDESTEVINPSKLQALTFCVSNHIRTFLEQEANTQTLDTEDSLSEDEQPPPIPERLYLEDDTPCVPNLYVAQQEGGTTLQDTLQLVKKRGEMTSPASDRICQPMLPRRPPKPEYEVKRSDAKCQDQKQSTADESDDKQMNSPALPRRPPKPECKVTQSDAKYQDREQSIAVENESKQMTSPASDRIYQPLLPRRQRKPEYEVTRSDVKCQDDEQPIAAENKSKEMTSPASDRIYQPLLPRRQRKPEYEVTRSDVKCQDREQPTAGENKMNSPASDHIYQPLLPRRTAQQENAEYQSLRFKN